MKFENLDERSQGPGRRMQPTQFHEPDERTQTRGRISAAAEDIGQRTSGTRGGG